MQAQAQLALPFAQKTLLDELQDRHPFWLFYANDTRLDVEIRLTEYGTIFVQLVVNSKAIHNPNDVVAIDRQLNAAVQAQLQFESSFIQY